MEGLRSVLDSILPLSLDNLDSCSNEFPSGVDDMIRGLAQVESQVLLLLILNDIGFTFCDMFTATPRGDSQSCSKPPPQEVNSEI